MNPDPITSTASTTSAYEPSDYHCHSHFRAISWGAIFAGAATAIALQLLLTLLGSSIGLGIFDPLRDPNPLKNFTIGGAIIWSVCAWLSLWLGGMVAGFFSNKANHKSGGMHGVVVWSVVMLASFALISVAAGLTTVGAVKAVGAGLGIAGKAAADTTAEAGKEAVQNNKDQISSFLNEASDDAANAQAVKSKRDIGLAATKLFNPANESQMSDNRTALIKVMSQPNGTMTEADATKMVDEWTASYNELKAQAKAAHDQAEQKAREEADEAAHNLAWASAVSFVAFLIGLSVTIIGAKCGACCACRARSVVTHTENYPRL